MVCKGCIVGTDTEKESMLWVGLGYDPEAPNDCEVTEVELQHYHRKKRGSKKRGD